MSKSIRKELAKTIKGFTMSPPDSDYQRGYLAALVEQYSVEHMRLIKQANRLLALAPSRPVRQFSCTYSSDAADRPLSAGTVAEVLSSPRPRSRKEGKP